MKNLYKLIEHQPVFQNKWPFWEKNQNLVENTVSFVCTVMM